MTLTSPWRVEWHAELPSTMDRARDLAQAGAAAGTIIVADYQSAGRGTQGRLWLAPPGTCLMFTLIARPRIVPAELEQVPLRVGQSIATALHDTCGLACEVKEPNDIMVRGRKLCGILCTSHIRNDHVHWLLCGIGLNTTMSIADLPLPTATSLAIEGINVPPPATLLDTLLSHLTWLID